MSWFKRKPQRYPPAPHHTPPHRTSPAAERAKQKAKEYAPTPTNK